MDSLMAWVMFQVIGSCKLSFEANEIRNLMFSIEVSFFHVQRLLNEKVDAPAQARWWENTLPLL